MRTLLIALMMTFATQAGAESHSLYWYEDRIKAFHCDTEVENPTIFYKKNRVDNEWYYPAMSVLGLDYEIEQKGDDKFIVKLSNAQVFFNLKEGAWSRTIVNEGEVTEHSCKDVSEFVATVATSIVPFVEENTLERLERDKLLIDLMKAQIRAIRKQLQDAEKQITKMKYLVSQAMDFTLSEDDLDKVLELQREGYIE